MRTKSTPWNRSYKENDLIKTLKSSRRGGRGARSQEQRNAKQAAQKNFRIHEQPKTPRELPEDWKAIGQSRKRAMESVEDRLLAEELREVWE